MSAMGAGSLAGRLVTCWLLDRFFAPYASFAHLAVAAFGTFLLSDAQSVVIEAAHIIDDIASRQLWNDKIKTGG
jgi:hypothetical protein